MIKCFYFTLFVLLSLQIASAQVGIGTETPSQSSILDVESTTEGVLLPRMSTAQRNAIPEPANGLTVFDTDQQTYYFYNDSESRWERLSSSRLERDNYVLVKSQDDFPEASGGRITLETNTYYELNGTVVLDTPIVLNGAYVAGEDPSEDVLTKSSGNVFEGSGGSIRNISITGGSNAFSITSGASFFIQNTIIANMANVGTVSGIGFVFASNVQFVGNSNGVVYSDIDNLLLNNQAWQAGNSGTFEKFEGEFDLIQKASGFSIANGDATAIDVSSNPTVSQGVINGTVFSGSSANYINKYTTAAINLNFTKDWFVQVSGIQDEYDDIASGNIFYEGDLNTGYTITSLNTGSPFKLTGTTTSSNLLRFIAVGNNRLEYIGNQQKRFSINASLSVRGTSTGNPFYAFFIRKNGSETLEETNSIFYVSNTTNVSSVSITGNVMLSPGDYIEIWGQKLTGTTIGALTIFSQNLTVN
jgi:hypothetical protein